LQLKRIAFIETLCSIAKNNKIDMADYLKDINIKFLTLQSKDLDDIHLEIDRIYRDAFKTDDTLQFQFILRYDGIGIIRNDFTEIKNCFDKAKIVERLVFKMTSNAPDYLNRKSIEIRLDKDSIDNSILIIFDNDESWVDNTFKHLEARLDTLKNKNHFAHSNLVEFFIQIVGVLIGLLITFIASTLLAPKIPLNDSFFIVFIGFFLIFSNLWTYILISIRKLKNRLWGNISFKKKPIGLLGQIIISSIIGLVMIGLFKISWDLIIAFGTKLIEIN